jgi:hypothetical protein
MSHSHPISERGAKRPSDDVRDPERRHLAKFGKVSKKEGKGEQDGED